VSPSKIGRYDSSREDFVAIQWTYARIFGILSRLNYQPDGNITAVFMIGLKDIRSELPFSLPLYSAVFVNESFFISPMAIFSIELETSLASLESAHKEESIYP
jgi:hypothetical protein